MTSKYEAIVIGSGQGGTPLAVALAQAGWKTGLIERAHVGGNCVNQGCTPTKTMVASARVAYLTRRAIDYGVMTSSVSVDLGRVRERTRKMVESFRTGSQKRLENTKGLDLVFGQAQFTGPRSIQVKKQDGKSVALSTDKFFINTGGHPVVPLIPGMDHIHWLDSTSIMELDQVPEHLLVLGGGYIGLEFGQMFHRFGSRVTILQRSGQLLTREDPDIAEEVQRILEQDGLEILLGAQIQKVIGFNGDGVQLLIKTSDGQRKVSGSHLLVAAGRAPNTDELNLQAAGVETDPKGYLKVNQRLETSVPGIYALGDVKGGPAFTHISYDDFRILRTNLLEQGNASTEARLIPYTVFIDPQLARVGLNETEARTGGKDCKVARMPMSWVARALEVDEPRGLMKVLVDAKDQHILGITILGIEAGELMAAVQIAMKAKLPYTVLRDGIFAHPTLAESFNNLFANLE